MTVFFTHTRDLAAFCEYRRDDPRRGCSTVLFPPHIRCKTDQNQVELNALFGTAAGEAWAEW